MIADIESKCLAPSLQQLLREWGNLKVLLVFTAVLLTEQNLTASTVSNVAISQQVAMATIVGEEILAKNVVRICDDAASLSDAERFQLLADWVLPSETYNTVRLQAQFRANDAVGATPERIADHLASPALDLLQLAARLNRLPEIRDRLAAVPPAKSDEQRRAQVALQAMLAIQMDPESPEVEPAVRLLAQLIEESTATQLHELWPETLVAVHGMRHCPQHETMGDLLNLITSFRTAQNIPQGCPEWHGLVYSMSRRHVYGLMHGNQNTSEFHSAKRLEQWQSNPRVRAYARASGFPPSIWTWDGIQTDQVSGHEENYLLYQSPLQGDFAIDFDTPAEGQAQLFAGGHSMGPQWRNQIIFGDLRRGAQVQDLTPELNHLDAWVHCRVQFQGQQRATFFNGRQVRIDHVAPNRDPWIGLHCWSRGRGGVRDLRITGHPTIPNSISLATDSDLAGWFSYQEDSVGFPDAAWRFETDDSSTHESRGQIVARHFPWLSGTFCERLLRYHRPLLEDGQVEYEFFCEPGRLMVFPALDRLAFVFDDDSVSLHQITDDRHVRSETSPGNPVAEEENLQMSGALPLKRDAWNRMQVSIHGQTVSLLLNDQLILKRKLEPENSRHFGLFYFADQTGAKVRNITMAADWPKAIPSAPQQELANSKVTALDQETAVLGPVFHHEFSAGLPEQHFLIPPGRRPSRMEFSETGIECTQTSAGASVSSVIQPLFEVRGDFDISTEFEDWHTSNRDFCGTSMVLTTPSRHRFAVTRRVQSETRHWAVLEWAIPKGNGELDTHYETLMTEATGGRLRAVRQGDHWYALFADHDTLVYRIIGEVTMPNSATLPVSIEMHAVSGEAGTTQFTWKDVRIASNELMLLPDQNKIPKVSVFVMNADGSERQRVSVPGLDDPGHGSPDWSPDGKQIAYDCWRGSASRSQILITNADGSDTREVGSGSMPTFSRNGKQIAYSGQRGISIMNVDGSQSQVIVAGGWGAQWSPDGRTIAYSDSVSGSRNIALVDVATRKVRHLLQGEDAKRYSQIYWNMDWSPDSQRICFKGTLKSGDPELALVSAVETSGRLQVLTNDPVDTDPAWHPDGTRIMIAMPSRQHFGAVRLFVFDLNTRTFQYLPGQPDHRNNTSGSWSPNGQQIAFICQPEVKPVRWNPNENQP